MHSLHLFHGRRLYGLLLLGRRVQIRFDAVCLSPLMDLYVQRLAHLLDARRAELPASRGEPIEPRQHRGQSLVEDGVLANQRLLGPLELRNVRGLLR